MRRNLPFVVAALVVAAVAVPMVGMAAVGDPAPAADTTAAQTGNTTDGNATVAPGERMSGVIGVQKAEVEGEVDRRAFGLQVASAATAESKAGVVAGQVENIRQRLDALEARKANLTEARENGSITAGKYRAQVAGLSAKIQSARTLANATAAESEGLPEELLASKGVNVTAIKTLQERAGELRGGEIAEIARDIAGPPADRGPGDRRPDDRGRADQRPGDTERETPTAPGGNRTDDVENATGDDGLDTTPESDGATGGTNGTVDSTTDGL
jgi:hypothetical protein